VEKPLQMHTHESDKDGQVYNYTEMADEFLPVQKREKGLVATDMDGTLFSNDLGQLVFVEKLAQAKNWQMRPSEFNRLLIPEDYRNLLQRGSKNFINGLNSDECRKVLMLREDIIELYEKMYEMKRDGKEIDVSHPIANEFAMKMIKLDKFFMIMDSVLMQWFEGMFLMRTRFYAGADKRDVKHLTRQVMRRKNGHKSMLKLGVHTSNKQGKATKQRLNGKDLGGDEQIDRIVHEISGTSNIIMDLFGKGMKVRVVTTNLKQIASTALEESRYSPLLEQYCGGHLPIVASTLQNGNDGKFNGEMETLPIFGENKLEVLIQLQRKMRHKVMCALGDSPKNDTPMGRVAIHNGGVFVVVHDDYEKAREKFDPFYQQAVKENPNQKDIGNRIWYVDNKWDEE
jgi:phosphoserine phosphatase